MSVCPQIFEWVKEHGGEPIIPFSGILEAKIFDMPDDEKATYLKEVSLSRSCLFHCQQAEAIWKDQCVNSCQLRDGAGARMQLLRMHLHLCVSLSSIWEAGMGSSTILGQNGHPATPMRL